MNKLKKLFLILFFFSFNINAENFYELIEKYKIYADGISVEVDEEKANKYFLSAVKILENENNLVKDLKYVRTLELIIENSYFAGNRDKLPFLFELLKEAAFLNDRKGMGSYYLYKGFMADDSGESEEVIVDLYEKALKEGILNNNRVVIFDVYLTLGLRESFKGNHSKAIEYYILSEKYVDSLKDELLLIGAKTDFYYYLGIFDEVIKMGIKLLA